MKSFDPKCEELAKYFLPSGTSQKRIDLLSQQIQETVEDWIEDQRSGAHVEAYDDTPNNPGADSE